MANSQDGSGSRRADMLAAVVLHTLTTKARDGMTVAQVARECERNPESHDDQNEVEIALSILVRDDLARRDGDRFVPTRAAIRASELSF